MQHTAKENAVQQHAINQYATSTNDVLPESEHQDTEVKGSNAAVLGGFLAYAIFGMLVAIVVLAFLFL